MYLLITLIKVLIALLTKSHDPLSSDLVEDSVHEEFAEVRVGEEHDGGREAPRFGLGLTGCIRYLNARFP